MHFSFDLLSFQLGLLHPSGNLVVPHSHEVTQKMLKLVQMPSRHSTLQPGTPGPSHPPALAS